MKEITKEIKFYESAPDTVCIEKCSCGYEFENSFSSNLGYYGENGKTRLFCPNCKLEIIYKSEIKIFGRKK